MNERLLEIQHKIDELSQRERVLVMLMVLAVIYLLLQFLLLDPLSKQRTIQTQQIQQAKSQTAKHTAELAVLNAQLIRGVHPEKQKRVEALKAELQLLNKNIEDSVVSLIPPRLMAEVLEEMLTQDGTLKLISLENKPVEPIVKDDKPQQPLAEESNVVDNEQSQTESNYRGLYKHAFVLTLEGNYLSTIKYFDQLSKLPWRFYWDDLHYEVVDYPNATITLEVHTVSMSEEWIGV